MEELVRTRLKMINQSVESLIGSSRDALNNLSEGKLTVEEVRITANKLNTLNERFISETYNYFKLINEPSADEVSRYTTVQMEAEELVAEMQIRAPAPSNSNSVAMPVEQNTNVTTRLPRMELARFNGDVLKWHQFWDQFTSNVDTRNINDVDKLLYLQSVLSGEAKQAIDGLDTTSKNYKIAVETLKERYGKSSAIIDAHYVALYRIQTAGNSIKECRNVLSEVERHLRVLQSLGEDVNHNHLRVMLMEKFPEDLIYELRIKMGAGDESIDSIRKNLEYIISARETSNRLKRDTSKTNDKVENFTLETFHVRTENGSSKRFQKREFKNFRTDEGGKFDSKKLEGSKYRKRTYEEEKPKQQNKNRFKKTKFSCVFCNMGHYNDECPNFKSLQERKLKLKGRCYNCFGDGHRASECKSKRNCHHCGKFGLHNRALCPNKVGEQQPNVMTKTFHVNTQNSVTVLQTGIVHVFKVGDNSRHLNCRVLLDCGSQRSYVTAKVVKQLGLPVVEENRLSVFTFGARSPQVIESPVVDIEIVTRTNKSRTIQANVVPLITQSVPCPYGNIQNSDNILKEDMILADDGSRNDQVDVLLGNDYYYSFMSNQKIEVERDLFLVNTDFGWVWSGRCPLPQNEKDELSVLTYFQSSEITESHFYEPDLPLQNDNLKHLWDLETIGIVDSPKCSREEEAIKNFNDTTQYIDNRYYVKWPWVEYPPTSLPVNYGLALGRLTNLIKRLDSNTMEAYNAVLKDQLEKGIIEEVKDPSIPSEHPLHYLPHHCVLQDGKTTKLRIVYDASAKTKDNSSLNECLYRGPLMLEDLTGLLIRFREHRIGIVADVEKAFLQVGLQLSDRDVTRFLWVKDVKKEISPDNILQLRFCRVPFGVISSPFLLNATIKHHLTNSNNDVNKRISEDIYVDNLVTGTKSVREALILYETTKKSFQGLSMNIREWNSNSETFLNHIPQELRDKRSETIKILGIDWDTKTDELRLKPNYESSKDIISKRGVLKVTASIYDPCGFVAPIVLPAKLLLQDLWKQKLKWDDTLPQQIHEEWNAIKSGLENIKDITVPRLYSNTSQNTKQDIHQTKYELHGFADASKQAYAAVVYLRGYEEQKDTKFVSFVLGKSRLAPIKDQKDLQIPRLELLAAVIGSRIIRYVAKFLHLPIQKQFLWVDSEIVLNWYNSEKLLPPFVTRRVNEIKLNKGLNMRYVPTNLNPADAATRARTSAINNKFWLSGPEFLKLSYEKWPKGSKENKDTNVQAQTSSVGEDLSDMTVRNIEEDDNTEKTLIEEEIMDTEEMEIEIEGEQTKKNNNEEMEVCQNKPDKRINNEENEEESISKIINLQKEHFPNEFNGKETNLSRSLKLFKDDKGLLRCGGRFQNTDWLEDKKYPIILPKNTDFSTKIIETIHKRNYHVGVSHTLAMLRNKYWIVQGRSQVQKVLRNCLQCRKYNGGPYKIPLMPPLPAERVRYSNPFTFTGLDYFGPLKIDDGSIEKRWVCLFTCLSVRAIHMEVLKDLSADECVMAIRRFVAVRGLPQVITSDNATQFKLSSEVLTSDYCVKNKIAWRFIPELAPWFGGFYERLIGLVKNCLKRTLDKHLVTQNQLCTIIKEIEAVVNTRPLTTVGQELEQVLTPSDFLRIGGPLVTDMSDTEILEKATVTKDRLIETWKRGQIILQEYIKMFMTQYLDSLRERRSVHKQSRVTVNRVPKVGDIVQIKSDQNRALWRIGKVSVVFKGSDGEIRIARVTIPSGETFTRSIGHLYPLELDVSNYESDFANQTSIKNQSMEQQNTRLKEKDSTTTPELESLGLRSVPDPPLDSLRHDSLNDPATSGKDTDTLPATRPKRASAQRARDLVKQWTQQLISLIL